MLYADTRQVYLGVGVRAQACVPSATSRGGNADISALPGLWLELDHNQGIHANLGKLPRWFNVGEIVQFNWTVPMKVATAA